MHVTASARTGCGLVYTHNEDALLLPGRVLTGEQAERGCVWDGSAWGMAVCDGMGGGNAGEVASREVAGWLREWRDWTPAAIGEGLRDCHRRLFELGRANPACFGLGTTIAGLAGSPAGLHAFNIGDARVYRFAGGFLQQLTRDDSLHQVLVDAGEAQGQRPSNQHGLLQSLGGRPEPSEIEPHTYEVRLRAASRFLLCSDGVTDMLDLDAMEAVLQAHAGLDEAVDALFEAALRAGGKDNLSVILAEVSPAAAG